MVVLVETWKNWNNKIVASGSRKKGSKFALKEIFIFIVLSYLKKLSSKKDIHEK